MPIELPLSCYEFEFIVQDSITLPSQPSLLWHSNLRKSLIELSCAFEKKGECDGCIYYHQCDVTQLFAGIHPVENEMKSHFNGIPLLVLQVEFQGQSEYQQGDTHKLEIVLCGNANSRLLSLVNAMSEAGFNGVGKSRNKMLLKQVRQYTTAGVKELLLPDSKLLKPEPSELSLIPPTPLVVSLKFLTPYKPSGRTQSPSVDFSSFLMAIIRRVGLMQYYSTGRRLGEDFKYLKGLTKSLEVVKDDLRFHKCTRYSTKRGRVKNGDGFIGEVTFNLEQHEALWPFIVIGQSLNVGKNASMGFGRYQVI